MQSHTVRTHATRVQAAKPIGFAPHRAAGLLAMAELSYRYLPGVASCTPAAAAAAAFSLCRSVGDKFRKQEIIPLHIKISIQEKLTYSPILQADRSRVYPGRVNERSISFICLQCEVNYLT